MLWTQTLIFTEVKEVKDRCWQVFRCVPEFDDIPLGNSVLFLHGIISEYVFMHSLCFWTGNTWLEAHDSRGLSSAGHGVAIGKEKAEPRPNFFAHTLQNSPFSKCLYCHLLQMGRL